MKECCRKRSSPEDEENTSFSKETLFLNLASAYGEGVLNSGKAQRCDDEVEHRIDWFVELFLVENREADGEKFHQLLDERDCDEEGENHLSAFRERQKWRRGCRCVGDAASMNEAGERPLDCECWNRRKHPCDEYSKDLPVRFGVNILSKVEEEPQERWEEREGDREKKHR